MGLDIPGFEYNLRHRIVREIMGAPVHPLLACKATIRMTVPAEVSKTLTDEELEIERPWVVIVWNDPINLMSYVAYVFRKLFGYSEAKANALMMDVHEKGRAVVASGTRTEAERDVHRLHSHGLWATLEND